MSSQPDVSLLLGRSTDELTDYSSPEEILSRLAAELGEDLPDDFLEAATPREPDDSLILRGTIAEEFVRRSWKDETELRDEEFDPDEFEDPPSGTVSTDEFEELLGRELRSIVDREYGTCSECNGSPELDCERCGGDAAVECGNCDGSGSESCSACRGSGGVTCPECRGREYLSCDTCDEEGALITEDDCPNCTGGIIRAKETCSQCQGQGELVVDGEQVRCSRCSGGWFSSGGVVAVESTCGECSGRGTTRRRVTCPDCDGNPRRPCGECSSTGSVSCRNCEGDGSVVCRRCDGTGNRSCPDCSDGTVTCSVCGGDRNTHKVVFRHTVVRPNSTDVDGELPHGVENPDWHELDPVYLAVETRAGETVSERTTEIDVERIDDGRYVRSELRYVPVRELTYDYGERNFRVREVNGDLYYTRYPEPETPGLYDRVRNLF